MNYPQLTELELLLTEFASRPDVPAGSVRHTLAAVHKVRQAAFKASLEVLVYNVEKQPNENIVSESQGSATPTGSPGPDTSSLPGASGGGRTEHVDGGERGGLTVEPGGAEARPLLD